MGYQCLIVDSGGSVNVDVGVMSDNAQPIDCPFVLLTPAEVDALSGGVPSLSLEEAHDLGIAFAGLWALAFVLRLMFRMVREA